MRQNDLSGNRILYFDYLRAFATLAVMLLHVSSTNWYFVDVKSFEWQVFNIGDAISRWGVPIFVMISGALFLTNDSDIGKIKKHIKKIIIVFAFWSILYATVDLIQGGRAKDFLPSILKGHYHMWFLYMIVGLYMLVPLLRKIVESQKLTKYFLFLSLIFSFFIPQIIDIIQLCNKAVGNVLSEVVDNMHFHFTLGYVGYFVLGYYLNQTDISKKLRRVIYIFGFCGFFFTIGATALLSIYLNEARGDFYSNFTLNVLLESVSVFVFFKYNVSRGKVSKKVRTMLMTLSKYSFGAYLVHALVLEQLDKLFGVGTLMCNPILVIIVVLTLVCGISYIISWGINRIPFLNKYIV